MIVDNRAHLVDTRGVGQPGTTPVSNKLLHAILGYLARRPHADVDEFVQRLKAQVGSTTIRSSSKPVATRSKHVSLLSDGEEIVDDTAS